MNTTSQTSKSPNGLRTQATLTIVLLAVQFVLGMVTNLYFAFPDTNRPDLNWAAARSAVPTFAHIILGILLLADAIVFVVRTIRQHNRAWIFGSWAGLISIIIAIYGGVTFTTTQIDAYSLVMALGFIVTFVAYGWGLIAEGN